jgi:hypothetical protein
MLECDADVFLRECIKKGNEMKSQEAVDYFLLNMYKSVNFWVGAIKGKNVCFNHDDKKHPNRVIKFDHSEDTIRNFLFNAWDHIAHAMNKQWYTQQLEELT